MGCPIEDVEASELVVSYTAGTLDGEQAADLERHLRSCVQCSELAEAQRTVWAALDAWEPMTPPADFDLRLFQRIAIDKNDQNRPWWRRWSPVDWYWRPAVPVAVACCALIAAFLVKTPVLHPQIEPGLKIEQVEHELDDIEMLNQLGVEKI